MTTRRVVYFSKAREETLETDIDAILEVARDRNAKEGITGLLLNIDGVFAQVLEGPAAAVDRVMASIENDLRHSEIVVVHDEETEFRRFNDWSMAYMDTDSTDLLSAAGFGGLEDAIATMSEEGAVPKSVIDEALERFSSRLDEKNVATA